MVLHIYIYSIYTRPLSCQAQYRKVCPIFIGFRYNGSLVTWTVICLTAGKFKPLIIPVLSLALSNVANVLIFMVLYDFYLLPA
jgi:hypothetical protein